MRALLIIDPQDDFVRPEGALSVPGAAADMERLARGLSGLDVDSIHVSLDTHQVMDVSHPLWWRDAEGRSPAPFTVIRAAEVRAGRWTPFDPGSLAYLEALEAAGRYPHVIWPEHCLIGSPGHNVDAGLRAALEAWERQGRRRVEYWLKGRNPRTEHFSAIRAEVPEAGDPDTGVNRALVQALRGASTLFVAGEAGSHCVANTVRDLVAEAPELAQRIVLLEDTVSPVPGFEGLQAAFLEELCARGMRLRKVDPAAAG